MTITIKNTRIHQRAQQVSQYWSQIDKAAVVRGTGIIIIVTQWLRNRQDGSVASELRNRQNYWRFRNRKIAEPFWRFCLLLMLPPIEWDLANRLRRRTLNPNPNSNPNTNPSTNPNPIPNPWTHRNPNPIFSRNQNKVIERKQKRQKRHRNIGQYSYISRFFCRAGGRGKEAPDCDRLMIDCSVRNVLVMN